ncbi:glycosyltransferase family 4 protein [bacterium]|nr:glycosyltransferase family 4 protein [bacterium]
MSHRLQICFDARKWRDGGIGVYIRNLIYGLLHQRVHLTLLTHDPEALTKAVQYSPRRIIGDPTEQGVNAFRGQLTVKEVSARPFSMQELFSFRQEVNWEQYDVFHTPNYLLPFRIPCPSLVTVHDLIHLFHPERAFYPFAAAPLLYSSLLRAEGVVCVSDATRRELLRLLPFGARIRNKTSVIPNALCRSFSERKGQPDLLRSRFQLTSPYFLSVLSTVKPHKGVSDLLDAFRVLEGGKRKGKRKVPQLVLVGQGTESMLEVEKLLRSADELKGVRLLGAVSDHELYQLYRYARALIVPSFREGFCLPVIEAQSVGTPVIARPIPAVIENISPRDLICEDFSLPALVDGVERFLELEGDRGREREEARCDLAGTDEEQTARWQAAFRKRVDPVLLGERLYEVYCRVAGREGELLSGDFSKPGEPVRTREVA